MRVARWALVLGLLAGTAWGESTYDQPYLGKGNENWARFVGLRGWDKPRPDALETAVREADVVCLGTAAALQGEKDGKDRPWYTGDVKIGEILKGAVKEPVLHLRWEARTTGIEDTPSRHVFFLRQDKDRWEVTRTCYVFPDDKYPKMRLYGAYDADRGMGMMAIRALVHDQVEVKGLKEALQKSFQDKSWGEWWSVAELAGELDLKYGGEVLRLAVAPGNDRKDLDAYAHAVESLAARGGAAETKTILEGIPKGESWGRLPESQAFFVVGKYGGSKAVGVVRAFVKEHPEYAVSAAFSLAEIGGKEARETVAEWQKDPELTKRKETISSGWRSEVRIVGELLEQAAKQMGDR